MRNHGLSCKASVLTVWWSLHSSRWRDAYVSCLVLSKGLPPWAYMLFYMLFWLVLLCHVSHILNYSLYLPSTARQHTISPVMSCSVLVYLLTPNTCTHFIHLCRYLLKVCSNPHCTAVSTVHESWSTTSSCPAIDRHEVTSTLGNSTMCGLPSAVLQIYHGIQSKDCKTNTVQKSKYLADITITATHKTKYCECVLNYLLHR